jgi:histidinol-phosphatase (PHP family)
MEATCRRALDIGLPGIAFTEHADHVQGVHADLRPLDVTAYLAEIDRCRALFPDLRILSGVELGEPHRFPTETAGVLAAGPVDRLLGSVHCFEWGGALMDASQLGRLRPERAADAVRAYFGEALRLARSDQPFQVAAHIDYPKRYWPHDTLPYREEDFEEELRAVLIALAQRGAALEVNTTRGREPARGLCPGPTVLRWWVEAGGTCLTFGSDAHDPPRIARGFALAAELAEAAGFRPQDDPTACWRR